MTEKGTPNYKLLSLALLIGLGGIVSFISIIYFGIRDINEHMQVVDMPGSQTLALQDVGTYNIFHELEAGVSTGSYEDIQGLVLTLTGPDGEPVTVEPQVGSFTYSWGGKEGYGIYHFNIDRPGEYQLSGSYPESDAGKVRITVNHNFMKNLMLLILGGFAALGVPGLLAVLCFIKALKPLSGQSRA